MRSLVEQRTVIDYVTLRDELLRRGELELVGGVEYLAELVNVGPDRRPTSSTTPGSSRTRRSCGG